MKRALAGLAVIPLLLGLAACTPDPEPTTPATPPPLSSLPHIELIAPANSSYYWDLVKAGAKAAAKNLNVNVSFNGPATAGDTAGELSLLRAALGHGLVGIGVAPPLDGMADVVVALDSAKAAGTPVVVIDTPVAGSDVPITTVMSNNPWIGEQTAVKTTALMGGKGSVVILTNSADPSATERATAFATRMGQSSGITVTTHDVKAADRAAAKAAAAGLLNHTAIYATTGELTLGTADAAKAASSKIIIVGTDASPEQVELVKDGTIAGAFAHNPFNIGYQTVTLLVEATRGNLPSAKTFYSDAVWYTKSNINAPEVTQIISPNV